MQPSQGDRYKSADRSLGRQAAGCQGMKAVAREFVRRKLLRTANRNGKASACENALHALFSTPRACWLAVSIPLAYASAELACDPRLGGAQRS